MPFTLSHIAAVLPLRARSGPGLPLAGLAAGSMSPDVPYFLPLVNWQTLSPPTHSLAGLVTWDLGFGLLLWWGWRSLAGAVHDLAPAWVRRRWQPADWPERGAAWLLVAAAVLVGAVTHVLWDEFTHGGRFAATSFEWVAATYPTPWGAFQGYRLLQYASGVAGLAIVVMVGWRQPVGPLPPAPNPRLAVAAWWLVPAAAVVVALVRVVAFPVASMRGSAFVAVTTAIGVMVVVSVAILAWQRRTRTGPGRFSA